MRDVPIEPNVPEGDEKPAEAQNTPSNLAEAMLVIEELRHSLQLASCEKQQAVLSEGRWRNKLTSMRELQDLVMVDRNLQHQQAMAEVARPGEMEHSVGVSVALHVAELGEAKAESAQLRQYLIESLECYTARVKELEDENVSEQTHQHAEQATKQLQEPELTVQRDDTGVASAAVTVLTPEPVVQPSSPQRAVICISYQTGQQLFMTRLRDEIEKVKRCYL